MTPGGMSLNVVEGDRVVIICRVKNEKPENIVSLNWFVGADLDNLEVIGFGNTRDYITVNQTNNAEGFLTSRLTIPSASFNDRAYYMCQANNGIASAEVNILIRIKDKLAALWPFLGIVGEVVILCTIIFIYEKRRSKSDFEEPNQNDEPKSPSTSAKAQEVRQRNK
jgi:hypothetical protein